ncbi:MAG: SLC13 family permease [Novosphingobium sp.]|nr:SLC13 family permease [Novosphingobium sp.]
MLVQIVTLVIFAAVFAVGEIRRANVGIVMVAAASGVGLLLAGLTVEDIVEGFPTGILILLVGVTFFFGIAKSNGTIARIVDWALTLVGTSSGAVPLTFFVLSALISAMGSPLGGLVMAPIGMLVAHRSRIDPMLMALAIGCGISAGGFAPTSLFGLVVTGTAHAAEIQLSPLTLFAAAITTNLALLGAAYFLFSGRSAPDARSVTASVSFGHEEPEPVTAVFWITVGAMLGLVTAVIVLSALGRSPDVGLLALAFGAVLSLIYPADARQALKEIDWSTVLLVGGIVTYVGVLEKIGAVDLLGVGAMSISTPLLAALVLCAVSALISAFASTTGILAALIPLAIPLAQQGDIPGWALVCTLALCSSVVDVSPFSTVGAALIASAPDPGERPRMTTLLARWGLSMVVIAPVIVMGGLILVAKVG